MKEITRIHIAKVAYDIEVDAKKGIEKYIAELESYANDPEILDDIEIRITELLLERGVAAGGVITAKDVSEVRAQLGEPSDFASDGVAGDTAKGVSHEEVRRVYRDIDSAVLGGVLAGFGRFFGIDPLWVRLVFIVLLLASFGTAFVVYLILWMIIPPARTAAQKLQMQGKPVTLTSIKEMGEKAEPAINETAFIVRRVLRLGTGITLIFSALAALTAVAVVAAQLFLGSTYGPVLMDAPMGEGQWLIATFACFAIAGLLLSALGMVLANATLRGAWNRRTTATVAVIIAAGLIAFAGGVGTTIYGHYSIQNQVDKSLRTSHVDLPANFASVKKLTVEGDDEMTGGVAVNVTYIVSDKPRYELDTIMDIKPEFTLADDSLSATVKITGTGDNAGRWGYFGSTELRIYGPALDSLVVSSVANVSYLSDSQDKLALSLEDTEFYLNGGTYREVSVTGPKTRFQSLAELQNATVNHLTVSNEKGHVTAGVVRSLTVSQPDACPSYAVDEELAVVRVEAVSSGVITYNGAERPAATIRGICGGVVVGDNVQ